MKLEGAKGMLWFVVENGRLGGSMAKLFDEKIQKSILKNFEKAGYDVHDDQYIFAFGDVYTKACKLAGILRSKMGDVLNLKDPNILAFAWIVNFPIFV